MNNDDDSTTDDSDEGMIMGLKDIGIREKMAASRAPNSAEKGKQTTLDRYLRPKTTTLVETPSFEDTISRQMSFSFQLGDDKQILSCHAAQDQAQRRRVAEHISQIEVTLNELPLPPNMKLPVKLLGSTTPPPAPAPPALLTTHNAMSHRSVDRQSLAHRNSSTSMRTAIRDNSGRSSMNSSPVNANSNVRPMLRSAVGSSEAVTAALRAIQGSKRKASSSEEGPREESVIGGNGKELSKGASMGSDVSKNTGWGEKRSGRRGNPDS
jgi:hypothetical protein